MKNVVWGLLMAAGITPVADHLEGILGCWTDDRRSSVEAWSKTEEGDLLGFGVSWNDEGLAAWETLQIRRSKDATVLTAYPGGSPSTAFQMVALESGYVRFENPEHDFPQVIEYRWTASSLDARVSHLDNDKALEFRKIRCEASE